MQPVFFKIYFHFCIGFFNSLARSILIKGKKIIFKIIFYFDKKHSTPKLAH